jgi:transcriptional regulator with XRE-family HTH domain
MSAPFSLATQLLGARVRRHRERLGCNQEELARLATVNVSNLGRIERGRANPSLITIVLIAGALNVDPGELVTGISAVMLGIGLNPAAESPALTRYPEISEASLENGLPRLPSPDARAPGTGHREIIDHGDVIIGRWVW